MLATLEPSSAFFSGSCGDFAAVNPANSKHAEDSHTNETNPFDRQEQLLIETLNSTSEMIASGQRNQ
jgi:hypothetical protein